MDSRHAVVGRFFLGFSLVTLTEAAMAASSVSELPGVGASVIRLLGAFCIVLAILFGGVWLARRWPRLSTARSARRKLQVLESRALGARQSIVVVGYEQQRLLLATSPAGVTFLTQLPSVELPNGEEDPLPSTGTPFLAALEDAVVRRS